MIKISSSCISVHSNRDFLLETGISKFLCDIFYGKWETEIEAAIDKSIQGLENRIIFVLCHNILCEHQQMTRKLVGQYCSKIFMKVLSSHESSDKEHANCVLLYVMTIPQLKTHSPDLFNEIQRKSLIESVEIQELTWKKLKSADKCAIVHNLVEYVEGAAALGILKCLKSTVVSLFNMGNEVAYKLDVLKCSLDQKLLRKFLSEADSNEKFVMIMEFYHVLMTCEEEMRRNVNVTSSVPVFSALAFSPGTLKRMWIWLVDNLHVPKEAPLEATMGWNIDSLKYGMDKLESGQKMIVGIFCNCYNCVLMVCVCFLACLLTSY